MDFFTLILKALKAIESTVAPSVRAAIVSVKGQVEIAGARSHFQRNNGAPAAEAAVVVVKLHFGEVGQVGDIVDAVVGALFEIVAADFCAAKVLLY